MTTLRELMQKKFYIPYYQRNYSWQKEHVTALLNDYDSAVKRFRNTSSKYREPEHYLANIILMERKQDDEHVECKDIIDGQQRTTTIIMVLSVISKLIADMDNYGYIVKDIHGLIWPANNKDKFLLHSPGKNKNIPFLDKVLKEATTKEKYGEDGQGSAIDNIRSRYFDICEFFNGKIKQYGTDSDEYLRFFYERVTNSEVTTHEVTDIVEANRIFITLNARGKPLSNFDKIKGLLIYFAAQAGKFSLANDVHMAFTSISEYFEKIDGILHFEKPTIKLHASGKFNEDTLISWHYRIFKQGRQIPSAEDVYKNLDDLLNELSDKEEMELEIRHYIETAVIFSEKLSLIMSRVASSVFYFETIALCQLHSAIWPLVIACEKQGILDSTFSCEGDNRSYSILFQLRVVDKILKLRQVQGGDLIELAYTVFESAENSDDMYLYVATEVFEYHRNYWKGHRILDKLDFSENEKNEYWNYLFLSYLIKDEEKTIESLRAYRKESYYAIPVLRHYVGLTIKNHGYNRRDDFSKGIRSLGNFILVNRDTFDLVGNRYDDGDTPIEVKNKVLSAVNSKSKKRTKSVSGLISAIAPESLSFLSKIKNDSDISKLVIDTRNSEISEYFDTEWEVFNTAD